MNDFGLYLNLGWKHIANLRGIDHLLFITALCVRYHFIDWKKLLLLITSFTIGHTITLILSIINLIRYSQNWIEFLIPVTIAITAFTNLFVKKFTFRTNYPFIYFLALFFGLIHGLGYSSYLKSIMGNDKSIFLQLLAFNLGLEVGQILVVVIVLLLSLIFVTLFKFNRREYLLFISGGIFAVTLKMAIERYPI